MVGTLRSFRTARLADLIAFDAEEAYVGARLRRGGLERLYELTIRPRGRSVRLDGKAVRPISRYFGELNVVLFAPEDLQMPRGSPAERRRFLDRAVFNRQPRYLAEVQAYDKVVKNRNALLRDLADGRRDRRGAGELLAVFDEQLADRGARLVTARRALLAALGPRFSAAFEAITQSGLAATARYLAPDAVAAADEEVAVREALAGLLSDGRVRDLARGSTSVGPHRDDLAFELEGRAAAAFASQGQLRAMVLAWKTAEMDLLAETHGEAPILLLDDVSSELDPTRNEYLFEFLRARTSQCFITTTHPRYVLLAADRVDFEVRGGCVSRQNGA